jgi:hypothetical protein
MTSEMFEAFDNFAASLGFGMFKSEKALPDGTVIMKWEGAAITLRLNPPRYHREVPKEMN